MKNKKSTGIPRRWTAGGVMLRKELGSLCQAWVDTAAEEAVDGVFFPIVRVTKAAGSTTVQSTLKIPQYSHSTKIFSGLGVENETDLHGLHSGPKDA